MAKEKKTKPEEEIEQTEVDVSIETVLFETWVGRGCLLGIGVILLLFYRQVRAIDR